MPGLLRASMIAIALAVCAAATLDFMAIDVVEGARRHDQEVLNLAGRQRMLSQRAAHLAARLSIGDDAESLSVQLQEAAQQLRRDRERLLAIPRFANMADQAPSIEPLSLAMQAASREAARGTSGTSTGLAAAQAVAQAADQFLPAMEAMMTKLQLSTEQAIRDTEGAHSRYMSALAVFVSLVALGAGEWLARKMTRQQARLRQQTQELERLALVAERTDSAVIITDAEGRMTWANDAFTRISGFSLYEVLGKKPGSLLQFEGTN